MKKFLLTLGLICTLGSATLQAQSKGVLLYDTALNPYPSGSGVDSGISAGSLEGFICYTIVGGVVQACNFAGGGSITATSPLHVNAGNLTIDVASGSQPGALASADWTTFNGKQAALTNPVTGPGSGATAGDAALCNNAACTSIVDGGSIRRKLCAPVTTDQTVTGTTSQTAFNVCSIPANTLKSNSQIFVTATFTATTGNTGTCAYNIRLTTSSAGVSGGMNTGSITQAATKVTNLIAHMSERNSSAAQFLGSSWLSGSNALTSPSITGTQDTTAQQYLALAGSSSAGGTDSCVLNEATYEYIP